MALAQLVPLSAELDKDTKRRFRGLGLKWAKIKKVALGETARFWHDTIFPKHFSSSSAAAEYGMERRRKNYLITKHIEGEGQGKFLYELFKGTSYRRMMTLFKIVELSTRATLTMDSPAYFTRPFIGDMQVPVKDERTGKTRMITRHIRRQPDKPAEVTRVSAADFTTIRNFMNQRMAFHVTEKLFAYSDGGGI